MPGSVPTIETPILIVGGGSVGLALASDLGARGVPCIVVEQNERPADHPRATALNARSMEFMRRWGIADAVREKAAPPDFPHTALYCTSLDGFEIARIERPHHGGAEPTSMSPERAQRCNQIWLDPILAERAMGFASNQIKFRWRFEELCQEASGVTAIVHDLARDARARISARYLIDCSGGHSPIRRALGIPMLGSPYIGYHLSVYVRAPELWAHHDKGKAALINFVEPKGLWRNMVTLDGRELYRFGLRGKELYDDPDNADVAQLFREVAGKDTPFEIISVRRWTARNVVAERYQVGDVFLAGDAAHLNHPASGLGLNTGLGDAVDLGWKLEAAISGWGGAQLLSSYAIERRPIGKHNVGHAEQSHANDRNQKPDPTIADDSPEGARARREMGEAIVKAQTRKFVTDGIALGYRYEPSPVCWGDETPPPPESVSEYHPTTRAGSRAPHAWLGNDRSIIDLYGGGFVLVRLGKDPVDVEPMTKAFAHRRVPLTVTTIADPSTSALYERALVLVRPDGHVAWRSDVLPLDPLKLADRVRGADATAFDALASSAAELVGS